MSFLLRAIYHPRKLLLRRVLFQVHLWAGVLLSLYVLVIALTGAVLVFEDELTTAALPRSLSRFPGGETASVSDVMRRFAERFPSGRVTMLTTPSTAIPAYQLRATGEDGRELLLVADPGTGDVQRQPKSWVNWVHDLHVSLLLGSAHGIQVNGVGAVVLLLLTGTGLVLWWPGLKIWTRGLRIGLRHHWRRITFDAHSAIGVWTLVIVSWWSISGIYFAWYRPVSAVINEISPLRGMVSPQLSSEIMDEGRRVTLDQVLAAARRSSPSGRLFSVSDPSLKGKTVYVLFDLQAPGDFSHRDIVSVDTQQGRVLTVWHYGRNESPGDWILWSMHPLHFGTLWGLSFKVLWAALGVGLAVLSVTGVLMYWNRDLRHRWKRISAMSGGKSASGVDR